MAKFQGMDHGDLARTAQLDPTTTKFTGIREDVHGYTLTTEETPGKLTAQDPALKPSAELVRSAELEDSRKQLARVITVMHEGTQPSAKNKITLSAQEKRILAKLVAASKKRPKTFPQRAFAFLRGMGPRFDQQMDALKLTNPADIAARKRVKYLLDQYPAPRPAPKKGVHFIGGLQADVVDGLRGYKKPLDPTSTAPLTAQELFRGGAKRANYSEIKVTAAKQMPKTGEVELTVQGTSEDAGRTNPRSAESGKGFIATAKMIPGLNAALTLTPKTGPSPGM